MKKVKVYIEAGANGYFSAYMDDTPLSYSCVGQGKSVKATIADFNRAYSEMKQYYQYSGKKFEEVEFIFYYDDAIAFLQDIKSIFKLEGISKITGINAAQLGHYIQGVKKPTSKTSKKIEEGVLQYLEELKSVKFK